MKQYKQRQTQKHIYKQSRERMCEEIKWFLILIVILDNSCIIDSYLGVKWIYFIATSKTIHVLPTHSAETALFLSSRDRIIKSPLCVAGSNFESHSFDADAIRVRNGKTERFDYRDGEWGTFLFYCIQACIFYGN